MNGKIRKRDGREVDFDLRKIEAAVRRAFVASDGRLGEAQAQALALDVARELENNASQQIPTVENVQDLVEQKLIEKGFASTAKAVSYTHLPLQEQLQPFLYL